MTKLELGPTRVLILRGFHFYTFSIMQDTPTDGFVQVSGAATWQRHFGVSVLLGSRSLRLDALVQCTLALESRSLTGNIRALLVCCSLSGMISKHSFPRRRTHMVFWTPSTMALDRLVVGPAGDTEHAAPIIPCDVPEQARYWTDHLEKLTSVFALHMDRQT